MIKIETAKNSVLNSQRRKVENLQGGGEKKREGRGGEGRGGERRGGVQSQSIR